MNYTLPFSIYHYEGYYNWKNANHIIPVHTRNKYLLVGNHAKNTFIKTLDDK